MIEIRFHGRGGQGAVTSAELLAHAAIAEGRYAQAFPSFGPERRGAPVLAFARLDDKEIFTREMVYEPNVVIVLDEALIGITNVEAGMKPDSLLVVNTKHTPSELKTNRKLTHKIATVDATSIAIEILKRPITNTTMLGAALKAYPIVSMDSLCKSVEERFGAIAAKNILVLKRAFQETKLEE